MHDTTELEAAGIPCVFVSTVEFEDGARAQAKSLGSNPPVVYTEHPIQDRTDAEMVDIADRAFDGLVDALTRPR